MKYLPFILLFSLAGRDAFSQDTIRVMSYNLLRYYPSDRSRDQFYRRVILSADPDVLIVQEIDTASAVLNFLTNVLNGGGQGEYSTGVFVDGEDSDNAVFFKTRQFTFIENKPIKTRLRDINQFTLEHVASGRTFHIFSLHLKAGNAVSPEADSNRRSEEVDSLRKVTDLLPQGTDFMVLGDFNIYGSFESAYQKLVDPGPAEGYVVDPLTMTGTWNNPAYASFHTQSTRVRSFGYGATGGLDDRFDMILVSKAVSEAWGIWLLPGSYMTWGNDGQHYNDSINRLPNAAVADSVADALHNASDHLPVVARFVISHPALSVERIGPSGGGGILTNFPNPFNPSTVIRFRVVKKGRVDLRVFDLLGREIAVLVDEERGQGTYTVRWDASSRPGGMYFCRMTSGGSTEVRKMMFVK